MHCPRACVFLGLLFLLVGTTAAEEEAERSPRVVVRGIYGGVPQSLMDDGRTPAASGIDAVWVGERGITAERVALLHDRGARIYAEFNTLHRADYLEAHPDAWPVGPDGTRAEAPHGWQGVCPTHEAYRRFRMDAFRALLADHDLDGVWLDYHHAHASWERAEPALPDTCFCARCLERLAEDTGLDLDGLDTQRAAERLLGPDRETWISWRCGVFTDWVREFREIRDATRPGALLGTFHCPWTAEEHDGALRAKLAIDLRAQREHIDVFSPMPYHARFGHAADPAWISRSTAWLHDHLRAADKSGRPIRIWPIVQLSDWGEPVPVEQVEAVLDHGTRAPATGVLVFAWGSLRKQPEKVEAMVRFFRGLADPPIDVLLEPGGAGARDRYWDDKHAARADAPVPFRRDVEQAILDAKEAGSACFLDFETEGCGPCKNMDRWVYTAKEVVEAARGTVCVKIDADERKDLKDCHGVKSFPTGILLGPDGAEVARFSGYRSVKAMAAFFSR